MCTSFFFFNDPATTEIYTLSLHDALPISFRSLRQTNGLPGELSAEVLGSSRCRCPRGRHGPANLSLDRKSTRLNSSHLGISYAVFCLKKKKKTHKNINNTDTYV